MKSQIVSSTLLVTPDIFIFYIYRWKNRGIPKGQWREYLKEDMREKETALIPNNLGPLVINYFDDDYFDKMMMMMCRYIDRSFATYYI